MKSDEVSGDEYTTNKWRKTRYKGSKGQILEALGTSTSKTRVKSLIEKEGRKTENSWSPSKKKGVTAICIKRGKNRIENKHHKVDSMEENCENYRSC